MKINILFKNNLILQVKILTFDKQFCLCVVGHIVTKVKSISEENPVENR